MFILTGVISPIIICKCLYIDIKSQLFFFFFDIISYMILWYSVVWQHLLQSSRIAIYTHSLTHTHTHILVSILFSLAFSLLLLLFHSNTETEWLCTLNFIHKSTQLWMSAFGSCVVVCVYSASTTTPISDLPKRRVSPNT